MGSQATNDYALLRRHQWITITANAEPFIDNITSAAAARIDDGGEEEEEEGGGGFRE